MSLLKGVPLLADVAMEVSYACGVPYCHIYHADSESVRIIALAYISIELCISLSIKGGTLKYGFFSCVFMAESLFQ